MFPTASVWDDPRNIDLLKAMWLEGASASEIANAIGQGVTRNGVIGKVHRMKLPKRKQPSASVRAARPAQHGNKGVPKVNAIVARAEKRQRSVALAMNQQIGRAHV